MHVSVFGLLYFHRLECILFCFGTTSATLLDSLPVPSVLLRVRKEGDADEGDEGSAAHDQEVGEVATNLLSEDGVADDADREEDDDVAEGNGTVLLTELLYPLG